MATQTPTPAKQGVRAAQRSALQRIESLENDVAQIAAAFQQVFGQIEATINQTNRVLDALIEEVGAEKIQERMKATALKAATEQAEKAKASLAQAVEANQIRPAEVVTEQSIIVGRESDAEGNIIPPGYVQLAYFSVKPEFQERLLGQTVGHIVDTANGGAFEVTEIYEAVPAETEPVSDIGPVEAETAE